VEDSLDSSTRVVALFDGHLVLPLEPEHLALDAVDDRVELVDLGDLLVDLCWHTAPCASPSRQRACAVP
jgi:hypothetical protein